MVWFQFPFGVPNGLDTPMNAEAGLFQIVIKDVILNLVSLIVLISNQGNKSVF